MANSFGGASKPNLNVSDTNTLMQQGLSSNLSMDPQVVAAMKQYGPEYGAAVLAANQGSNPNLKNLSDLLNQQMQGAQTGMPSALQAYTQNSFRDAQASRGFGDSPMSSLTESQTMGKTYADYVNELLGRGNEFARNPGMQMTGPDLQKGLGLEMPSVLNQYNAQFQGQEYQNNISLATTNMTNSRNQQTAARYGAMLGPIANAIVPGSGKIVSGAFGSAPPTTQGLIAPTGNTAKETSDSSITTGNRGGTSLDNPFGEQGGLWGNLLKQTKTIQ